MKIASLTLCIGLAASSIAIAHDKVPFETNIKTDGPSTRAEFLGLHNDVYVKTPDGMKLATSLSKGQLMINKSGKVFGTLSGKVIVKLNKNVSAAKFAEENNLKLDWESKHNLLILSAPENENLLKTLELLKNNPLVLRAKLDRKIAKNIIQ